MLLFNVVAGAVDNKRCAGLGAALPVAAAARAAAVAVSGRARAARARARPVRGHAAGAAHVLRAGIAPLGAGVAELGAGVAEVGAGVAELVAGLLNLAGVTELGASVAELGAGFTVIIIFENVFRVLSLVNGVQLVVQRAMDLMNIRKNIFYYLNGHCH